MAGNFVGSEVCSECHQKEYQEWKQSHHDLAMQHASAETVLGDFYDKSFNYFDITSTFFKREGKYFVKTDDADGNLDIFEIKYTFGVYPLQQYLIEFDDGRLQVLSIAWDSRVEEEGGQRWFHLYSDNKIIFDDPLHWTKLNQNWNFMCAECHSTNLEKNFDKETNRYKTTWSEIDVGCEACHGPGESHVDLSKLDKPERETTTNGLAVNLENDSTWIMNPASSIAARSLMRDSWSEIETCALCHSRRAAHQSKYTHGDKLIKSHVPAILEEGLYHIDGQIDDEVFVYGSFLQSKMYQKGVTCSDCHNPHSLQLKAQGNDLCSTCHLASKFDTPKHHFHSTGSEGAQCTACHMPEKTYMSVDDRADHSFPIPRPDLSIKLDVPNTCTQCHENQSNQWAADKIHKWYSDSAHRRALNYGEIIHAGRRGHMNANDLLVKFINDTSQASIKRATAMATLQGYLSPGTLPVIKTLLHDNSELVRLNAIGVVDSLPPELKTDLLIHLLSDNLNIIRIEAGRALADSRSFIKDSSILNQLDSAIESYITSQYINAERPEAHTNLGALYSRMQEFDKAESAYKKAIEIDPAYAPAYINLADLYRSQSDDKKSMSYLNEIINRQPESGLAHHSLGLLYIRKQNLELALQSLRKSIELEPANTRFNYIYAVALDAQGKTNESITILERAHKQRPVDPDVLYALVNYHQKTGQSVKAKHYAKLLTEVSPWDQNARLLFNSL